MLKKLLQAVVITFALYCLVGMQSQANSVSQTSTERSPTIAKVINAVKNLL